MQSVNLKKYIFHLNKDILTKSKQNFCLTSLNVLIYLLAGETANHVNFNLPMLFFKLILLGCLEVQ